MNEIEENTIARNKYNGSIEEARISQEEDLPKLNEIIHKNLVNRKNGTDYHLLYEISRAMISNLKLPDRNINKIATPSAIAQTKSIALQFFKDLDSELYEKAKNIVDGSSEFDFNMYMLDGVNDFSSCKASGMPAHTKIPCVMTKNGKSAIYVPCKGTVEDIYLLVHEISHTFDFGEKDNSTRNLLGEVTSYCFEAMLSRFLTENGILNREDVTNREKGDIINCYDDVVETFAKLELMRIKEQKGNIRQTDISEIRKAYSLSDKSLQYILNRLEDSKTNVDYKARYMVALLVYPYYMEQYEKDSKQAVKSMKAYFDKVKAGNFIQSLESLGIEPTFEQIQHLIDVSNKRIASFFQQRLFSVEEIGKATINVPTNSKDEAKFHIAHTEKLLIQDDKNDNLLK